MSDILIKKLMETENIQEYLALINIIYQGWKLHSFHNVKLHLPDPLELSEALTESLDWWFSQDDTFEFTEQFLGKISHERFLKKITYETRRKVCSGSNNCLRGKK